MKAWIWHWGPAVIIMAIIFAASATPGSEMPKFGILDLLIKKGGHMLGYALLATAFFRALRRGKSVSRFQFILSLSLTVLYAISDEWHQSFTPGRTPSFQDVCIDAAGGFIGLALWYWIRARRG